MVVFNFRPIKFGKIYQLRTKCPAAQAVGRVVLPPTMLSQGI